MPKSTVQIIIKTRAGAMIASSMAATPPASSLIARTRLISELQFHVIFDLENVMRIVIIFIPPETPYLNRSASWHTRYS
jgi:predicted acylesterase/phospholipase RssA